MAKVYLLSTTYLKVNTPLNLNVDDSLLTLGIWDAQEINIQQILGSELYREIKALVADAGVTPLTDDYKKLMDDYITPCLLQYSLAEVIKAIRYKFVNKSVAGQNSENSVPVELDELKYLTAEIKNKAEFYAQRLTDFVMANVKLYPKYNQNNTCDDIVPNKTSYFSGLVLDEGSNCRAMDYLDVVPRVIPIK